MKIVCLAFFSLKLPRPPRPSSEQPSEPLPFFHLPPSISNPLPLPFPFRSALDAVLDDERWGEALEYNRGAPMPHEGP